MANFDLLLIYTQATGKFPLFSFTNIRYGQPPVGDLRFAPSLPPTGRNTTIANSQRYAISPQAYPGTFIAFFSN